MRDSFAMVMPILIIGSMFTLLRNFPIPAWIDFLKTTMVQPDKSLFALLAIPSACTVSLMAIFLAFNIGYNFAEHIGIKDRASAGIVSLVLWGRALRMSSCPCALLNGRNMHVSHEALYRWSAMGSTLLLRVCPVHQIGVSCGVIFYQMYCRRC